MIYKLPIPKSPELFESITCDLLNALYKTTSFSLYGRKGQNQNGMDIISFEKKTVAQCKLRNLNLQNRATKLDFINEIIKDVNAILHLENLPSKIIIATTIENDTLIQDQLNTIMYHNNLSITIEFWSWDYISSNLFLFNHLVNKYYPHRNNFIEIAKIEVLNKKVYQKSITNERLYQFIDNLNENILPIFDITFINNTENTILLNSIDIITNLLPIALAGPFQKTSGILKVTSKFVTTLNYGDMRNEGKTTIELEDPLYALPKAPFRIQIQLTEPLNRFVKLKFAFHFSSDTIISPEFFFNSEKGTSGRIFVIN